ESHLIGMVVAPVGREEGEAAPRDVIRGREGWFLRPSRNRNRDRNRNRQSSGGAGPKAGRSLDFDFDHDRPEGARFRCILRQTGHAPLSPCGRSASSAPSWFSSATGPPTLKEWSARRAPTAC